MCWPRIVTSGLQSLLSTLPLPNHHGDKADGLSFFLSGVYVPKYYRYGVYLHNFMRCRGKWLRTTQGGGRTLDLAFGCGFMNQASNEAIPTVHEYRALVLGPGLTHSCQWWYRSTGSVHILSSSTVLGSHTAAGKTVKTRGGRGVCA